MKKNLFYFLIGTLSFLCVTDLAKADLENVHRENVCTDDEATILSNVFFYWSSGLCKLHSK